MSTLFATNKASNIGKIFNALMVIASDVGACAYINLGLSKVDKQTGLP